MGVCKLYLCLLLLDVGFRLCHCNENEYTEEMSARCQYIRQSDSSEDLTFTLSDLRSREALNEKRKKSRVCLPKPCADLKAYSGFVSVDDSDTSFLFFLTIKSKDAFAKKPLLLWLQGGPGKSSLFGEFLENGPLGIDASRQLYYRNHTLLNYASIVYLDQPVGSGYSFARNENYTGTLEVASTHILRFLRGFVHIFPEYRGKDFFIAGESYGARFAIGAASKILKYGTAGLPLNLKGVMLGVGFLFPLLEIIDSTKYLYYTGLLDREGKTELEGRFRIIRQLVTIKNYTAAAYLLSQTVMNLRNPGQHSLFEMLTGFLHHGSVTTPQRNIESFAYHRYANSTDFKKRVHVDSSRTLDGTRQKVVAALAEGDFFIDHQNILQDVLNSKHVLFYTAQLDDVFPAVNIEREFRNVPWRGSKLFIKTKRTFWYKEGGTPPELFGYEKRAGTLLYASVLFGGHYISLDRSSAVSDLYRRFFDFQKAPPPNTDAPSC